MREAHVDLHLPRFKVEESYDLKDTLRNMGMVDLFNGDADLSGMTGSRGLMVSEVLHKAFVEVTEEGAEAAAATAVVTEFSSPLLTNEEFHCNHPFLFFIRQNKTNSILFFGRFSSPQMQLVCHSIWKMFTQRCSGKLIAGNNRFSSLIFLFKLIVIIKNLMIEIVCLSFFLFIRTHINLHFLPEEFSVRKNVQDTMNNLTLYLLNLKCNSVCDLF